MKFILPYPPSANNSPGSRKRKAEYTEVCHDELAGVFPMSGELYISIRFFPKNYYNQRGDLDNLLKTLLDAIKGKAIYDDSQIRAMYVMMMDSDYENPHVEVAVSRHKHNYCHDEYHGRTYNPQFGRENTYDNIKEYEDEYRGNVRE